MGTGENEGKNRLYRNVIKEKKIVLKMLVEETNHDSIFHQREGCKGRLQSTTKRVRGSGKDNDPL